MIKQAPKLLCITCPRQDVSYRQQTEFACQGGADMIQFRDKNISDRELFDISVELRKICEKYKVDFTVNNRADIAYASNAHGVHIGQKDLPAEYARELMGPSKIIGMSASTYSQAVECQKKGADYVGFGAIFSTPTKPEANEKGTNILKEIKNHVTVPVIAIGGIDETNVKDIILAGADGVAVVRAVCGAKDIKKAAENMKNLIIEAEKQKGN